MITASFDEITSHTIVICSVISIEIGTRALTKESVRHLLATPGQLQRFGYLLTVPSHSGGTRPTDEGFRVPCQRCEKLFTCRAHLAPADLKACNYHWGRKKEGRYQQGWTCCPSANAPACTQGPHTIRDFSPADLHARSPFVSTNSFQPTDKSKSVKPLEIIALDCELVCTTAGYSLARLTVVDEEGKVILDEHIRPQGIVLDLNTRFSGVQKGDIEKAKLDLGGVRKALGVLGVNEDTILIGHGLENDLSALRWVHTKIVDTAIIFPHPEGGTFRHSLRHLASLYLKRSIQDSGASIGHSAAEDAIAALDLVKYKVQQGRRGNH